MPRYSKQFSVGLTGGIGSGKTTVTDCFEKLGAGIIDADDVSRSLTADGQPTIETLAKTFGDDILKKPGVLNRDKLREMVFNNKSNKIKLEAILHPLIRAKMKILADELKKPYLIFSIPLLIEGNQQSSFDRIVVINAPKELRIKWVNKRSGLSDTQIRKIMDAQISTSKRLESADDVINNDDTLEHVYRQVEKLHQRYLSLSSAH